MDSVKIPYVIDNQSARMADVLNGILAATGPRISREDLQLVCFDSLSG